MRTFGVSVRRNIGLSESQSPVAQRRAAETVPHRRLYDSLEEVFFRACATDELDSAADLLAVLEQWQQRRASKYGRERQVSDGDVKAMRAELDRKMAIRAKHLSRLFKV